MQGYVITSHRSVSLQKVAHHVAAVLDGLGFKVKGILGVANADPTLYDDVSFAVIVMTFDPVWANPYFYLYRMLKNYGKRVVFYTTIEGRPIRTPHDTWVYRDCEFVANSKYTARKLREAGARVVAVVPHGVDVELFERTRFLREEFREKLGISSHEIAVGYLAAGYKRKGHQLFNEVARKVYEMDKRIRIVVLTDEDGLNYYEAPDNTYVIPEFGNLSEEEVVGFFHAIDVYAHAALAEGFGLPVLEALAAGKLVVHPDYEPLSEITTPDTSVRVRVLYRRYEREATGIEYEMHYYSADEFAKAVVAAARMVAEKGREIQERAVARARELDIRKTYRKIAALIAPGGTLYEPEPGSPGYSPTSA